MIRKVPSIVGNRLVVYNIYKSKVCFGAMPGAKCLPSIVSFSQEKSNPNVPCFTGPL